ncbi:MAG: hypothetical protein Q7R54_01815 [bacterium]|nr:hypothetical protein [bacterium]
MSNVAIASFGFVRDQAIDQIILELRKDKRFEDASEGVLQPTAKIKFDEALQKAIDITRVVREPAEQIAFFFTEIGVKKATANALAASVIANEAT